MTVIAGIRAENEVIIAADSQQTCGDEPVYQTFPNKLIHVPGKIAIGIGGWTKYSNIMRKFIRDWTADHGETETETGAWFFPETALDLLEWFQDYRKECHKWGLQEMERDRFPFGALSASMLVGTPGGLFFVSTDLSVNEVPEYFAVGNGENIALGAMYALGNTCYGNAVPEKTIARAAVLAANRHNIYCGGRVQMVSIPLKSRE